MTFEREIYYILKDANKPMTTTEIVDKICTQYCGNDLEDHVNYTIKLESWAAELKTQNTNIKQRVISALWTIVKHQYAKTWTEKEELGFYKGKRQDNNPCQYKTYIFRYWQAIK